MRLVCTKNSLRYVKTTKTYRTIDKIIVRNFDRQIVGEIIKKKKKSTHNHMYMFSITNEAFL